MLKLKIALAGALFFVNPVCGADGFVTAKATTDRSNISIFLEYERNYDPYEDATQKIAPKAEELVHIDIPYELLATEIGALDPRIESMLVHSREGVKYFRWVMNPQDQGYERVLRKYCKEKRIPFIKQRFFKAHRTISRSVIVDAGNGFYFGLKSSTTHVSGERQWKKQEWEDAKGVREVDEYLSEKIKNFEKQPVFMRDVAAFGIREIDQALVIRDLSPILNNPQKIYINFAAVEQFGESIRMQHLLGEGATQSIQFASKELAEFQAELLVKTGFLLQSPHGQNTLVEFSRTDGKSNFKPTNIVIRDYGDMFIDKRFSYKNGTQNFYETWHEDYKTKEVLGIPSTFDLLSMQGAGRDLRNTRGFEFLHNYYTERFKKKYFQLTGETLLERYQDKYYTGRVVTYMAPSSRTACAGLF